MANPTAIVLSTVNAPYHVRLDAATLAEALSDAAMADRYLGPVYTFFTEVPLDAQWAFVQTAELDFADVQAVASHVAHQFGHEIALAA